MKTPKSHRQSLLDNRYWLLLVVHATIFATAYGAGYWLRFDFTLPDEWAPTFWVTLPCVVALKIVVFSAMGQFHGWWRVVTFQDLFQITCASAVCLLLILAADYSVGSVRLPRSVLILDAMLGVALLASTRSTYRVYNEVVRPSFSSGVRRAALVGIDDESLVLASQLQSYGRIPMKVVGLLDGANSKILSKQVGSLAVLGSLDELESIVGTHGIELILIQAGQISGSRMRQLMDQAKQLDLELQIVPGFADRMNGSRRVPIRDINIDDLLRREAIRLDRQSISDLVRGKTVLVTGAGGSIGSEICRQIVRFAPERLVLLGRGENRIYEINNELGQSPFQCHLEAVIADIRNGLQVNEVMARYRPDLVFHAAAHKHVPLMENNVREAISNNLVGTQIVSDAAEKHGVARFVLISSDKAVRPTSVMGSTKRAAEQYIQSLGRESKTRFMIVRFGNVLGSAGSVVPLFKQQIQKGGPITITDERMTRFFMTIPEASQLVLQAAAMGLGGDLFVLDMGEPIRIVDLATDMIRLAGLPEDSIEISFTGRRPGEKMHEELAEDEGHIERTSHAKILSVHTHPIERDFVRRKIAFLTSPTVTEDAIRKVLLNSEQACFDSLPKQSGTDLLESAS